MSTIQNLYHGTTCQISIFKPFSHFGNKDVALDAIARKIVDYDKNKAFLVNISLHAPDEQMLEIEDWGVPNSQGLASALKWSSEGQEKERFQEILNDISKDREEEKKLWNEMGFKKISKILRDRNISILKYKKRSLINTGSAADRRTIEQQPARYRVHCETDFL